MSIEFLMYILFITIFMIISLSITWHQRKNCIKNIVAMYKDYNKIKKELGIES